MAIVIFLFSGLTGYAYYVGNATFPEANVIEKIQYGFQGIKMDISNQAWVQKADNLNVLFNSNVNLIVNKDGKVLNQMNLKIKNGGLLSRSDGLQQRIQLGELTVIASGSTSENFSLKNVDIVTDNEKVYSYIGAGSEKLLAGSGSENFGALQGKRELAAKLAEIYGWHRYAMFDNSKPTLKALWDFSKIDLFKKMALAFATSNPQAYFEKAGGVADLKKFLASDRAINFIFKNGTSSQDGSKTNLVLNEQSCQEIAPLIANLEKEFGWAGIKSEDPAGLAKECEASLKQLQPMLSIATQIYKEWDISGGNYKFTVAQGNVLSATVTYKAHVMEKWSLEIEDPNGQLTVKWNGDAGTIASSLIKLNYVLPNGKIIGEITNGSGKIEIDMETPKTAADTSLDESSAIVNTGETNTLGTQDSTVPEQFKVHGSLEIQDYKISNFDIAGSEQLNPLSPVFDFSAKGNGQSGKVSLRSNSDRGEAQKLDFDYDVPAVSFHLNIDSKMLVLKSAYEKSVFRLDFTQTNPDGTKNTTGDLSYDSGKVQWNLIQEGLIEVHLNGQITTSDTFNFHLDSMFMMQKIQANLVGKTVSPAEKQFSFECTAGDKKIADALLKVTSSQENGFKVAQSKGTVSVPDQKTEVEFNSDFRSKEGWITYEIPKNFQETDIKLADMTMVPNLYPNIQYSNKQVMMIGGASAAMAVGFGFYSFQKYMQAATMGAWSFNGGYSQWDGIIKEGILPELPETESLVDTGEISTGNEGLIGSSESTFPWQEAESQILANISAIQRAIDTAKMTGVNILELVQRDESLEGKKIYIGGNLATMENYVAGTPNFAKLGMKPSDFQNTDGTEYLIGITTEYGIKYQVLVKTTSRVMIGGDYTPGRSRDPIGLVFGSDGEPYTDRVIE